MAPSKLFGNPNAITHRYDGQPLGGGKVSKKGKMSASDAMAFAESMDMGDGATLAMAGEMSGAEDDAELVDMLLDEGALTEGPLVKSAPKKRPKGTKQTPTCPVCKHAYVGKTWRAAHWKCSESKPPNRGFEIVYGGDREDSEGEAMIQREIDNY
jgi:hypothetical protein